MRWMRLGVTVCVAVMVLFLGISTRAEAANRMYWTDAGTKKIQRANLDGTGVEDLVTGLGTPRGIALDVAGGKMYWADAGTNKIQRANLDGTGVEDLVGSVGPVGIALDLTVGKVYWTDVFVTGNIQRANLDGTGVEDVFTVVEDRQGLALDVAAGKMYWTSRGLDRIRRANLDGTGVEDLVFGLPDPRGIALDVAGGKMYWAELFTKKIQRANLDGTGVEDLVTTGLVNPQGIALDVAGGKMYWADFGTDKIQRANLDGTGVEDLVTTGLSAPVKIALELVVVKEVAIDIKPGSDPNSINLDSSGVIPVAILSSATFDATTEVDPVTLTLAGGGVKVVGKTEKSLCHHDEDVNGDGLLDLVCQFENLLEAEIGDTIAVLSGETFSGIPISGEDNIRIVP